VNVLHIERVHVVSDYLFQQVGCELDPMLSVVNM